MPLAMTLPPVTMFASNHGRHALKSAAIPLKSAAIPLKLEQPRAIRSPQTRAACHHVGERGDL
jgi:hypothetical protein